MSNWSPTPAAAARHAELADAPESALQRALRYGFAAGLLGVCLVPQLRGSSEWIGWLPLWLVGMPAAAWWALHRFRLPRVVGRLASTARRRRAGSQARRRPAQGLRAARRQATQVLRAG
ncbi:hypothetical protein [Pseudoxanthomonas suwonensis]|uniref:hypothetical protein n=1 Tax=Pseudoxanthomonas suwonensis TaxID=314722 RepID=UPI000490C437|nr:hypothetical protein [Pseudoxanthomonas suwonensis]